MSSALSSEISKYNLIDEFLTEIDKVKEEQELRHIVKTYMTDEGVVTDDWTLLETLLISLDRIIQDIELTQGRQECLDLALSINNQFLTNGIEYLKRYSSNITLLGYLICNWIAILSKLPQSTDIEFKRMILFFDKHIYVMPSNNFDKEIEEHDLQRLIVDGKLKGLDSFQFSLFFNYIKKHLPQQIGVSNSYKVFDPNILEDDIFKLEKLRIHLLESVGNVGEVLISLSQFSANHIINDFLNFDDRVYNSVWTISMRISNASNSYDAGVITGNLNYFVEAIKSIGDIEVQIDELKMGSIIVKFAAKIKSLASEVDFKSVFQQGVLIVDAFLNKKSLTDLRKTDAERKKIVAETHKLEVENLALNVELIKDTDRLELYEKKLNIKKLEQEIELRNEEIKQKKIETIGKISEVIGKSIFDLDSNIQIEINNMVYFDFNKDTKALKIADIEIMDSLKTIEPKISSDSNTDLTEI